ncbi:leucine rich repeat protein [Leptospira alstonii serovar Pingchang str. 80-412]|uniref:Leucine rich repeat protein n=1 Tax=Leptospira alstonii serovar Pingchang str. 80-412 TaxID=1218564 RepID=T0H5Z2_9LEPT|nr:leucine rich repeat protein [Leptospira alstonii serovar Pingchang str. 80-412]
MLPFFKPKMNFLDFSLIEYAEILKGVFKLSERSSFYKTQFSIQSKIPRRIPVINMNLELTHLQKIAAFLLIFICLFAELQSEEVEKETYTDLTKALQNPSKVLSLDLCEQKLTTLPKEIGILQNLQWLDLSENRLTNFPEAVEQLRNLRKLYLYSNPLLPKEKERIRKALPKCEIYFGDK